MSNTLITLKSIQSESEFLDLQFFIDPWSFKDTKYINFQLFLEGESLNLKPNRINYIFQEEVGYQIKDNVNFDSSFSFNKDNFDAVINECGLKQLNNYLEEVFDDFIKDKNIETLFDKLILIYELCEVLSIPEEVAFEAYNKIIDFLNKGIFKFHLLSDRSAPRFYIYTVDNLKYIQLSNISNDNKVFEIYEGYASLITYLYNLSN